jgi:hypothetical protein
MFTLLPHYGNSQLTIKIHPTKTGVLEVEEYFVKTVVEMLLSMHVIAVHGRH